MTISKAQIFNIALNILGVSTPLENPNSVDNRAILLNNYYELARDYVLKDFDWNFASAFKELSLCEEQLKMSGFKFTFNYPNDCLFARELFLKDNYFCEKFSIATLSNGNSVILTDVEVPILRYTRRVEKEVFFTSEFAMALAHYLASLTANVIAGSVQKGENAWQKYIKILKHARVINAYESKEINYDVDEFLNARN
ncbi:MAG: hypothetical protein E7Z88_05090 [Cyanobacteria bacterium SIG27]|nr:hypothetical protein [Cyanobacteria bacterium SIG27]